MQEMYTITPKPIRAHHHAVHPHLFRHSFASWWLNEGGNPVDL